MVSDLGTRIPANASAGSFAQTLQAQGNSQEALAAGTGPFPPSPAPSASTASTASTSSTSAAAVAALLQSGSAASGALPALDTTSFGDDGSSGDGLSSSSTSGLVTLPSPAQLLSGSALGSGSALSALAATTTAASAAASPTAGAGQRALAAAQAAIGISESPSGSNDGPGLAIFRSAVAGAQPGEPWCAYFASWVAREGGAPLGDGASGLGSVEGISEWAGRSGRLLPAGSTPQAGDLVLFGGRHVGIVESVNADGTLTTVEGNYRNSVQRVRRSPLEATGYVRLG